MQQKIPMLESKIFDRFGSKDFDAGMARKKSASTKLLDARDNTLFIMFAGVTVVISMLALSMLLSAVSSVALASQALVDFMLEYMSAIGTLTVAACGGYMAPKFAYVKFTDWDVKMVHKHAQGLVADNKSTVDQPLIVRTPSPMFTSSEVLPDHVEPTLTVVPDSEEFSDYQAVEQDFPILRMNS